MTVKEIKIIRLLSKTLNASIHSQLIKKSCLILKSFKDVDGLEYFFKMQLRHLEIETVFVNLVWSHLETANALGFLESCEILKILQYPNHLSEFQLRGVPKLKVLNVKSQKNSYTIMESALNTINLINLVNLENLEVILNIVF